MDIDPEVEPDIVCDAKDMGKVRGGKYDAVHCSHNLEHFYRHEVPQVLRGFRRVLKNNGFAHIVVPNMQEVLDVLVRSNKDILDIYYSSPSGPITFHDVIYGWNAQMSKGNLHYAHKTGFTEKSLGRICKDAGFRTVLIGADTASNLVAFAFKSKPTKERLRRLGL